MSDVHTLYAITHSLYSGRARAYLIKQGIAFRELSTGHESFKAEVLPKGKLPTIPTLLTPQGEVIRDGAAIIEHFESSAGRPCRPPGDAQQLVSALFDVIGTDGLLRPGMHYRWNFPEDNLAFLRYHFFHSQRDSPERDAKTEHMMERMRSVAQFWGVSDETKSLVEALYLEFLDALNTHFESHPYLLGGTPCIGDFGLLAPLYAHLGRDPYPARLMQQRATRVFRWVERMNRADQDAPEYFDTNSDFLSEDLVPQSLLAVLSVIAEDFVPETKACAATINAWLEENNPAPGTAAERMLGQAQFELRGATITTLAQPYRFFLLQRVHAIYDALSGDARTRADNMFASCGMGELMGIRLERSIERADNLEVWN